MKELRIGVAICDKTGSAWNDQSLSRYWRFLSNVMRNIFDPVYSLAMAGIILSAKEFLFSTVFAGGEACWCPPIVPSGYCKIDFQQANSAPPNL